MKIAIQQLRLHRDATALAILAVAVVGLAVTTGVNSARWINITFPGFFVMDSRIVASVSLPSWPVTSASHMYHLRVIAVNDQPVTTSDNLYTFVRQQPAGSPITYTLETGGDVSQITLPSAIFTEKDYILFFGPYLLSGLALSLIGISVWFLKPATPASFAFFIAYVLAGVFVLTASDLYYPHWFSRLHVLAEAFFPAAFIHLALVFPIDYFRRARPVLIVVPYGIAVCLALAYEIFFYQPEAYALINDLSMLHIGVASVIVLCCFGWDYWTTASHLVRQRIRVMVLGFLAGFSLPAALFIASGVTGGAVAVNYGAVTAFVFPLSIGYAIVQHDLFEIETVLKRSIFYLSLTISLTLSYLAFLTLINFSLRFSEFSHSLAFPLLFTFGAVFFLSPLKDTLQRTIDRVFFRLAYDPKRVLETTSAVLASTLQLEEILALIWGTINETVGVKQGGIFLPRPDNTWYILAYPHTANGHHLLAAHALLEEVHRTGRIVSRYDMTNGAFPTQLAKEGERAFVRLDAQLFVPLIFKEELVGLIVLGQKESGAFFSADDINFLRALANQAALSIVNARAYQEIQTFSTGLEKTVEERTRALADVNEQLHLALDRQEQAYHDLQHSQENLVRAEKMAVLGRLTAGIAHEMNTPLGASLNSLKILENLVAKHAASIQNPSTTECDEKAINAQMHQVVHLARQWMKQAATHMQSLKLHTRDLQRDEKRRFAVLQIIENTRVLLAHRLRLSQSTLVVACPAPGPVLYGDPGRLGQVLTNLIDNAIDAYDDAGRGGGEIRVEVNEAGQLLEIQVRDHGCGIPAENLDKIFVECFSTKPLGKGTGLGLSISRDIVANFFGGTLQVESQLGQGSAFILRLPLGGEERQSAPQLEEKIRGDRTKNFSTIV